MTASRGHLPATASHGYLPATASSNRRLLTGPDGRIRATTDRGSGTVLVVALLGAVFTITAVLVPVLALLPANQVVQGAADAAALAAADTASGLAPGVPCETAARAAQLNGANLVACTVDGLIATVSVSRTIGVVTVGSRARAGPAP